MMSPGHVWIWYVTVGVILTVATVAAIRGGLNSRHALTAIRLAQSEVRSPQRTPRCDDAPGTARC
jgi:hypothetical protein